MNILEPLDLGALHWFIPIYNDWLDAVMRSLTVLGNNPLLACVAAVAALAFALRGRARAGLILALVTVVSISVSESTKRVVGRARPDVAWVKIERPTSPSFPSGHAQVALAVYGGTALLGAREFRRRWVRGLVLASGFGLAFVIGVSRMYLGVHYLTDVLGGWDMGLALALLAYWADQRWGKRTGVPSREEAAASAVSAGRLSHLEDGERAWAHSDGVHRGTST
jgi:undecaprenyl-diphosphatase